MFYKLLILMKSSFDFEIIDKVDVEDIIRNFRILSVDSLSSYLKEVWKVKYCL
jgi:hypothetical protein